jgi:hypothetical protein
MVCFLKKEDFKNKKTANRVTHMSRQAVTFLHIWHVYRLVSGV